MVMAKAVNELARKTSGKKISCRFLFFIFIEGTSSLMQGLT